MPILTTGAGKYAAAAGGADAAETTAFLARADASTTLAATERAAVKTFINGLVAASYSGGGTLFSAFDILYLFATDTSAHALLNLISSSFNATNSGCTFTADRGFKAATASDYIDSNFNASSAGGNYVQDSAHISLWKVDAGNTNQSAGIDAAKTHLYTTFSGDFYARINDASPSSGATPGATVGHFLGNRSGASATQTYFNGASLATGTQVSQNILSGNIGFVTYPGGTAVTGLNFAAGSAGKSLNSTDASNFYTLLRAYMTAVGVP
jgi:hypothetical protein